MLGVKARKSTTAALMTMPSWVDPIYRVTIPLAKMWLSLLWKGRVSFKDLRTIWAAYEERYGVPGWRYGKLPVAALALTLKRVGWKLLSPFQWQDHQGQMHEVLQEPPRNLIKLLVDACVQWQCRKVLEFAGFPQQEVWWAPLRKVIETSEQKFWGKEKEDDAKKELEDNGGSKEDLPRVQHINSGSLKKLSHCQAGSLAVVISGDTWTEERKHKKGWVEKPECRWCSKLTRVNVDTVIHRRLFARG